MHDPDGPTPKPPSTWGNTTGVALHNVCYRTLASGLPAAPETPPRGGALGVGGWACLGMLDLRNAVDRPGAE